MEIQILLEARSNILQHPEHFSMEQFFESSNPKTQSFRGNVADVSDFSVLKEELTTSFSCKTTGCIAGHIIALSPPPLISLLIRSFESAAPDLWGDSPTLFVACKILDVPRLVAENLFYEWNWPLDLKEEWNKYVEMKREEIPFHFSKVAAKVIDRFIEDEKDGWKNWKMPK